MDWRPVLRVYFPTVYQAIANFRGERATIDIRWWLPIDDVFDHEPDRERLVMGWQSRDDLQ